MYKRREFFLEVKRKEKKKKKENVYTIRKFGKKRDKHLTGKKQNTLLNKL